MTDDILAPAGAGDNLHSDEGPTFPDPVPLTSLRPGPSLHSMMIF